VIRSVEFDCETKSPLNGSQGITRGARMAHARFKDVQRAVTASALLGAFGAPPSRTLPNGSPNEWHVRLTRIAFGVMDPGAVGGAFKAIQDELAEWCGEKDERKAPWSRWEYLSEQPDKARFGADARFVYRVRIEVVDLATGDPVRVSFPERRSAAAGAKYRLKRKIGAATKRAKRAA